MQQVQFEVSFSGRAPAPVYERVLREADAGGEEDEAAPTEADVPPAGPPPRLKALYRALVRCFHPDMAGGGGRAIALWHELQAAYARGDLARMEVLAVFADMRDAGFVLGRPHELVGEVVQGDQLGRTIGFRTANIDTQSMLPRDGVYAAIVTLPNGTRVGGAVNVGSRPTVQGTHRRAEVHLFDQGGSPASLPKDLDEYGWRIRIGLIGWVRDQVKFDSLDVLQGQLERDVKRIAVTIEPMLNGETTGVSV